MDSKIKLFDANLDLVAQVDIFQIEGEPLPESWEHEGVTYLSAGGSSYTASA